MSARKRRFNRRSGEMPLELQEAILHYSEAWQFLRNALIAAGPMWQEAIAALGVLPAEGLGGLPE